MKRVLLLLLLSVVLIGILSVTAVAASGSASKYLVVSPSRFGVPATLRNQIQAAGGVVTRDLSRAGLLVVSSANPAFEAAVTGARAVVRDLGYVPQRPRVELGVSAAGPEPPFTGDDDPFFDLQWGHTAVDAVGGWEAGRFGAGALVAVLDEGVDIDHDDLATQVNAAVSTSFAEDCDGNIEDWNPEPGFYYNHGTHVAGTIAAADNAFGVIGVAPQAQIMAVDVLSRCLGFGEWDWLIAGIFHAADNGADVINMSLGSGPWDTCTPAGCYTDAEATDVGLAISAAALYANARGVTLFASSGNDAFDFDANPGYVHLPSDALGVISISATGPEAWGHDPANADLDIPASYTNYGTWRVDFAAPGGDFDYPGNENCTVVLTRPCWVLDMVFSTIPGGWAWSAGTSMAAPHAAGVAAQFIGAVGGSATPETVWWALINTMDDLGPVGRDPFYGKGRVNATGQS
jgi:subtilisin family serine protease